MFMFESTTDEKSASAMSSSNERWSGEWNNTDYIESVIPGFFDIIVKIFHNFGLQIF